MLKGWHIKINPRKISRDARIYKNLNTLVDVEDVFVDIFSLLGFRVASP